MCTLDWSPGAAAAEQGGQADCEGEGGAVEYGCYPDGCPRQGEPADADGDERDPEDGTATITRDGQQLGGHFFGQSSFARHALADARSVVKVDDDAPWNCWHRLAAVSRPVPAPSGTC
jgi:hypothetical protein